MRNDIWVVRSPKLKEVTDSHKASGLVFLIPFHMPDGLTNRTSPFMSRRLVLPSLQRCYASSFPLCLCSFGNLLRSRSIPVFCDRRFSLTSSEQTASCSSLCYVICWRKMAGHFLFPSAISQQLPVAVTDIPVPCLSFLGPWISLPGILPLKPLPGKQRLNRLITWIFDCPSFLMGTRTREILPVVKWEERGNQYLILTCRNEKRNLLKILFCL